MRILKSITKPSVARRALAILACATLLYLASGGVLPHKHATGTENACHVCQALHMPTLATAPLDPVTAPEFIAWFLSLPPSSNASDSFLLHSASRAPPTA